MDGVFGSEGLTETSRVSSHGRAPENQCPTVDGIAGNPTISEATRTVW